MVTDPDEYPGPGPTIVKTIFDDDENVLISKIIVKIIYPINHHDVENWVLWPGSLFCQNNGFFISRKKFLKKFSTRKNKPLSQKIKTKITRDIFVRNYYRNFENLLRP